MMHYFENKTQTSRMCYVSFLISISIVAVGSFIWKVTSARSQRYNPYTAKWPFSEFLLKCCFEKSTYTLKFDSDCVAGQKLVFQRRTFKKLLIWIRC